MRAGGRRRSDAVDRAIAALVRLVVEDTWTAVTAAVQLRRHVSDEAVLRRARSRVGWALAERSSIIGERAAATLDAALASSAEASAASPGAPFGSFPAVVQVLPRVVKGDTVGWNALDYPATPWRVLADDAPVKVRSWVDGTWEAGFGIAGIVAEANAVVGYRVRRLSDGTLLPAWVSIHEVMPDRLRGRA